MLENPGDELYFGEVYRTILQEAWLPEGAQEWSRVGKSRRGRRPTQQGPGASSPSPSQAQIRLCFSNCIAAWNALPWANPNDPPCDARWGKEYWKKQKDDGGYNCSYYDLFMKSCLKHCIPTGCVMPSAYKLDASPPSILKAMPDTEYGISFSGGCGPVSKYQGPGSFLDGVWTTPSSDGEGKLGFQDQNGAKGCVEYKFVCPPLIYAPGNPGHIGPDTTIELSVIGGCKPYTWSTTCSKTSFPIPVTQEPSNTLHSEPCCQCEGEIKVKDDSDQEVTGTMVGTSEGAWQLVEKWSYAHNTDCTIRCQSCVEDYPGCQHSYGMEVIQDEYKWVPMLMGCADYRYCEDGPGPFMKRDNYGCVTDSPEHPAPPGGATGWPWPAGCNPHYPSCEPMYCFVITGYTYLWVCP